MRQTSFKTKEQAASEQSWRHIDADGKRLGRLAVEVATVLMGKHRPEYTPHVDTGEYVIITNAAKVVMTGRKPEQKLKSTFSGYAGGIKFFTYGQLLETKPEEVVTDAVKRMLPKGRLGRQMIKKLRVFRGSEHPHAAQQPTPLEM
jgi:large subunit ribosomal protein L13